MSAGKITRKLRGFLYAALLLGPGSVLADPRYGMNMTRGVTEVSQEIFGLHMLVLWVVTIVGIGVFGVIIYSLIMHRKSRGAVASQFHESTTVEVIWTIVPLVILVLIAIPATQTLLKIEDPSDADISIKVTGWQWYWQYEYLEEDIGFFSRLDATSNEARRRGSGINVREVEHYLLNVDKPVVVPVNKKVRLLMTSNDVLHAWWVPKLGVKRDTIPGYINESWFKATETGTYRGQCAELCGQDHGFMPIVVNVVSESEYRDWVASVKQEQAVAMAAVDREWTRDELMKRGQEVYTSHCMACHQPNGQGIPGAFPALAGGELTIGPAAGHIDIVLNGKPGTSMAAFGAQLSDADLAAVITYERNSWGNSASVVHPTDVRAAR